MNLRKLLFDNVLLQLLIVQAIGYNKRKIMTRSNPYFYKIFKCSNARRFGKKSFSYFQTKICFIEIRYTNGISSFSSTGCIDDTKKNIKSRPYNSNIHRTYVDIIICTRSKEQVGLHLQHIKSIDSKIDSLSKSRKT